MRRILGLLAIVAGALASAGCTIARENVLASIDSVIGLALTQNEKSQFYEAEIGYSRRQAFSIPTGKTILDGGTSADKAGSTDPSKVPDVVAALRIDSGVKQMFVGMNVKELFATGEHGVDSKAAIAMFIAEGDGTADAETTGAAADAVNSETVRRSKDELDNTKRMRGLQGRVKKLKGAKQDPEVVKLNQAPPVPHPDAAVEEQMKKAAAAAEARTYVNRRLADGVRTTENLDKWEAAIEAIEAIE